MSNFVRVNDNWEALRSLASGSIGANYAAVGTGLTEVSRKIWLKNFTNGEVYVSTDGNTNNMIMRAGDVSTIDILFGGDIGALPKYFTFYVKHTGAAPTTGNFHIETMFGER